MAFDRRVTNPAAEEAGRRAPLRPPLRPPPQVPERRAAGGNPSAAAERGARRNPVHPGNGPERLLVTSNPEGDLRGFQYDGCLRHS